MLKSHADVVKEFEKLPFGERMYIIKTGQLQKELDGIETLLELNEFARQLDENQKRSMENEARRWRELYKGVR